VYDAILVPTDGSHAALGAVDHALSIAERFDATIHALCVVETDPIGQAHRRSIRRSDARRSAPRGSARRRRSRDGLDRHLVGSVTERVVRRTDVPVVVVREEVP